jgi:hypothetical protein
MLYLVYKTTNTLTNKSYIGVHQTHDINDEYLGSGKSLLLAIKKYGKKNFKKEILFVYDNIDDMIEKEIELVTEEWCDRDDTYNIMPGGKWGSFKRNGLSFKGHSHSEDTKLKIKSSNIGRKHSIESKQKMSENNFAKRQPDRQREHAKLIAKKTKTKTQEHRKKISESLKQRNSLSQDEHPNFGKKRKRVNCPYCNKQGANNTMKRFHFDNCKLRIEGGKSIGTDTVL